MLRNIMNDEEQLESIKELENNFFRDLSSDKDAIQNQFSKDF